MKKPVLIVIVLIGLIVGLSVVKAIVSNRLSTSGGFVGEVEDQISFYKTQNALLTEEFLTASSLTNIAAKALTFGFTNENTPMILKTSRPLAVRR